MTQLKGGDWLTMAEAAKLIGVSKVQVSRLVRDGKLAFQRFGVMVQVSRESAEHYRANRKPPGRPPATPPKPAKGRRKK